MLPWARLEWRENTPWSPDFSDGYFGSVDPRAEIDEVFITGNRLEQRLVEVQRFAIGETGFGSGLNFLHTLELWRKLRRPGAFLSFLSTEAFPVAPDALRNILMHSGIALTDIETLLAQYPTPVSGTHRLHFPEDNVILTLLLGDAAPSLAQQRGEIDAWYLDGFAPARNPSIWNLSVFREMRRLSKPGTTLGTFTVAGQVRRDLIEAGFQVTKKQGHGRKRERLEGWVAADAAPSPGATGRPEIVSIRPPKAGIDQGPRVDKTLPPNAGVHQASGVGAEERPKVIVVGAGIGGLATARALQQRGCEVTVLDPAGPGGGASGNPAALLTPHLAAAEPARNNLARAGMRESRSLIARIAQTHPHCILGEGVEHHGITAHADRRLRHLQSLPDPQYLEDLFTSLSSGHAPTPILFYPKALAVCMRELCLGLADTLNIRDVAVTGYQSVLHEDSFPEHRLTLSDGSRMEARFVVFATGTGPAPAGLNWETPSTVAGQMTCLEPPLQPQMPRAVTGKGYCMPAKNHRQWIGATYRRPSATQPAGQSQADDEENRAQLHWLVGNHSPEPTIIDSWYGERAVFPNRLPRVGAKESTPGVFLCHGFGSRGLLYAPLAAQLLADQILNLPEPLPTSLSSLFREHLRGNA